MADAEKTKTKAKPRSTFGWFPKLILWGVVITFGYLYLSSLDQQDGELSASLLAKINEISPIPISALPGMGEKSPAAESRTVAPAPAAETFSHKTVEPTKPAAAPAPVVHPVNTAESTPSTNTSVNQAAAPAQPVTPAAVPAPVAAAPQPAPAAMTPPPAPVAAPAPPATTAQQAAPAPANQMPPAPAAPAYNWEAMARHQAMMQAQYAAMQREADARMREYWERMQSAPAPANVPYGYPGYPAGYLPGAPNPQR
ncbi:hypothetical protein [Chromatium okenii]|nr:hypothetical protein [Chromatium okenii]